MATTATTVAVAVAAKVIKRTQLSFVSQSRISFDIIRNRLLARPLATKRNEFRRFCTSAANNVNVSEEEQTPSIPTATTTTSEAKSDENGPSVIDVAKLLDIRVGKILKAWKHEEADSLYVEEVDVGEAEPRIICSGLVKYVPIDYLQDRKVVVLANLKARNMKGVKSNGMLMAASDAAHENVELLEPPVDSVPGDSIWFGSLEDGDSLPDPASPNQVQKKKFWESVQPHLKTDDSCNAMLGEHFMRTSAGVVVSKSLKNANIS